MNNLDSTAPRIRERLWVTGVVQGVGFRPFVYGLALAHELVGFVGNNSGGVFIEVEGPPETLVAFRQDLIDKQPPLAHIDNVHMEEVPTVAASDFVIVQSEKERAKHTLISADVCVCDDCLAELFDSSDRRYQYPFTNCTNCGPRFTIIKDIPYDRPFTTMADFPLCATCQAEYDDPLNRRFHAQPNACPDCGPQIWLEQDEALNGDGHLASDWHLESGSADVISRTQALLAQGAIVAIKGLGGFHLACNATNEDALQELRQRKGRVDKPFAVMVHNVEAARQFATVSGEEAALLTSKERPILLLQKRAGTQLSELVAPGNNFIGIMLPYTPLHYLLLATYPQQPAILVMTSANVANELIVKGNDEARTQLATLADAFLMHNRDIHARCDDSVVRYVPDTISPLLPIRRSRGYAPFPVKLPYNVPSTLAVGGELKATFCITKDGYAFMSQHIGDMENLETLQGFGTAVDHFQHIFRCDPTIVAHDMHPNYLSTRWVQDNIGDREQIAVQHHHAHIASVMAEHQLDGKRPVIGFSFDGTGYGPDGAIWGGEVLVADYARFERAFHLQYVPLAGGDVSVKKPYRLALSHLWAAGVEWSATLPPVRACSEVEQRVLLHQLKTGLNSVPTSSMGRLFDAVAALVGGRTEITYEGQAAIEFEAQCALNHTERYTFSVGDGLFDAAPMIREAIADFSAEVPLSIISARFHNAVAALILEIAETLRTERGIQAAALSGGVFQNVTLLQKTTKLLQEANFAVYTHRLVPPNDGGLALGQAMVAQARLAGKSI